MVQECALKVDIAVFPARDDTEIGRHGVNLCVRHKARIIQARAAYSKADVVLWDKSLSAFDAVLSSHLAQEFVGPEVLLPGELCIIAMHHVSL